MEAANAPDFLRGGRGVGFQQAGWRVELSAFFCAGWMVDGRIDGVEGGGSEWLQFSMLSFFPLHFCPLGPSSLSLSLGPN